MRQKVVVFKSDVQASTGRLEKTAFFLAHIKYVTDDGFLDVPHIFSCELCHVRSKSI